MGGGLYSALLYRSCAVSFSDTKKPGMVHYSGQPYEASALLTGISEQLENFASEENTTYAPKSEDASYSLGKSSY